MEASPSVNKHVFMIENYPRRIERLPANMTEVQSRAKDIMFCDKTSSLIKLSKLINKQVDLIERLYSALHQCEHSHLTADQMEEIEKSYDLLVRRYGAKILSVRRIIRKSPERPYSQQNADFSVDTIKQIIKEGELNAMEELKSFRFKEQEYLEASSFGIHARCIIRGTVGISSLPNIHRHLASSIIDLINYCS